VATRSPYLQQPSERAFDQWESAQLVGSSLPNHNIQFCGWLLLFFLLLISSYYEKAKKKKSFR